MHALFRKLSTLSALALSALMSTAGAVELKDFLALPQPAPTQQISYGVVPSHGIDVFLPTGQGSPLRPSSFTADAGQTFPGAGREQSLTWRGAASGC